MGRAVCGFLLGWLMTVVCPPSSDAATQLSVVDSVLSGFVAMGTMVVPGISGSMMLVFMGTYDAIVLAVAQLNMRALTGLSVGAVWGGLVMVKLVDFVLKRFPLLSYCVIMSLVLASVPVLWVHIIVS
jgi:putative membrane protein